MLSVEATGKNIEQAINNALFELKAIREDVDIKIIEEGGLFKKARVLVSISPDEVEKYEKKEAVKVEEAKTSSIVPTKEDLEQKTITLEEDKDEEVEILTSNKKEIVEEKKENKKEDIDKARDFLQGVLNKASLTGNVEIREEGDEIFADIMGYGDIIGYRGEGLNALQYLTSVVVSKNNRHAKRIRVDCDNYRERRENSLIALAHRMEKKVERTNQSVKLEPMTANERRIIHTALSESDTVETMSKGEEPHRFLIIKPKN